MNTETKIALEARELLQAAADRLGNTDDPQAVHLALASIESAKRRLLLLQFGGAANGS